MLQEPSNTHQRNKKGKKKPTQKGGVIGYFNRRKEARM